VSGHEDSTQMKKVIEGAKAKRLVPIHTEKEKYHKMWHPNVKVVQSNSALEVQ
jgi:mRNA degradation ribonuclease J1/J2